MNRSSNKILLLIIAVLLLTNIGVLAWFLWYRNDDNGSFKANGATELLKDQVGFSQEQLDHYKKLRDQQRETIRPMYEDMRKSKDSLFRMLSDSAINEEKLDLITTRIGQKQKSLDLLTFHHFSELRKICTPLQKPAYDSMVVQMFRKMGKPAQRKK